MAYPTVRSLYKIFCPRCEYTLQVEVARDHMLLMIAYPCNRCGRLA